MLLGIFYGLPWLQWNGRQAVLFDLPARKFHLFGLTLWPQDFLYLSWLLILAALTLFFVTAVAGRVWCGYACPQTVWTEAFLGLERLVEGDRPQRLKLDKTPWTSEWLARKALKQFLWISFAALTGFSFVAFFTPARELASSVANLELGGWETFWILFYGFATYGNAGFLREQVCKYMCPYARFQSAMFDHDTLIVSYDPGRGEPRGARKRGVDPEGGRALATAWTARSASRSARRASTSARACSTSASPAPPAWMPAMTSWPGWATSPGLIRYATERELKGEKTHYFRPRVLVYGGLLLALGIGFVISLSLRQPIGLDILRDRNALYRVLPDGAVENVYSLRILNKDDQAHRYRDRDPAGRRVPGGCGRPWKWTPVRCAPCRPASGWQPATWPRAPRDLRLSSGPTTTPALMATHATRFFVPSSSKSSMTRSRKMTTMTNRTDEDPTRWYRLPIMWLVVFLPLVSFVGGGLLVALTLMQPDPEVHSERTALRPRRPTHRGPDPWRPSVCRLAAWGARPVPCRSRTPCVRCRDWHRSAWMPATARARVELDDQAGNALERVLREIRKLGYTASLAGSASAASERTLARRAALKRLAVAGFGMMQAMMLAFALYASEDFRMDPALLGFLRYCSLLVTLPVVVYAGGPIFRAALAQLRAGRPAMDVPVGLGIGAALVASIWNTFAGSGAVYYDAVTMFVFFLTTARFVELMSRHEVGTVTEALAWLLPARALRFAGGRTEPVPVGSLRPGDEILVNQGDLVAADGVIVAGDSAFNEACLTGESAPMRRGVGATVTSGSINLGDSVRLRVTATGEQTELAAVLRLLERSRQAKPRLLTLAERMARGFSVAVLAIAALVSVLWLLIRPEVALANTIAVLVVACPCALSLAGPAVVAAANTALARLGLLPISATALEQLTAVRHVLLDKTGTLTTGRPEIAGAGAACRRRVRRRLLAMAAALERGSSHPLALAFRLHERPPSRPEQIRETAGAGRRRAWWPAGTTGWAGPNSPAPARRPTVSVWPTTQGLLADVRPAGRRPSRRPGGGRCPARAGPRRGDRQRRCAGRRGPGGAGAGHSPPGRPG